MDDQTGIKSARAYVVIQRYNKRYSPEVALMRGTIFPDLYFPYHKRG